MLKSTDYLRRQGQAVGWRPLHHAAGGDGLRLREAKAWLYSMRRAARRLLLPSGGMGHGARQGGADNLPQCGDWNKVTISRSLARETDLQRMTQVMKAWYQIQVRAVLGNGANYDKEILLLSCFGASHFYSATRLLWAPPVFNACVCDLCRVRVLVRLSHPSPSVVTAPVYRGCPAGRPDRSANSCCASWCVVHVVVESPVLTFVGFHRTPLLDMVTAVALSIFGEALHHLWLIALAVTTDLHSTCRLDLLLSSLQTRTPLHELIVQALIRL